jgi:hypothetical protein
VFYSAGKPWLGIEHYDGNTTAGFMFANDSEGTSWPASETSIPLSPPHNEVQFAVINGRPCAITVLGPAGNKVLGYFEAKDNLATDWYQPEQVVLEPAISFPRLTGIGVPEHPAVAFYADTPTWDLIFAEKY